MLVTVFIGNLPTKYIDFMNAGAWKAHSYGLEKMFKHGTHE